MVFGLLVRRHILANERRQLEHFAAVSDGRYLTDAKTLQIAGRVFVKENLHLVTAPEKVGARARPIVTGVFTADYLDRDKYGLIGKLTRVDKRPIEAAITAGALPVLTSLDWANEGQPLNVNADGAAWYLSRSCASMTRVVSIMASRARSSTSSIWIR